VTAPVRNGSEPAPTAESEERFRGLIDSHPNGVLILEPDGSIAYANSAAYELFGYVPGELVGCQVEMLVPHGVRPRHARHRANYLVEPTTRPMGFGRDLSARRKDGTEVPVEIGLSSFVAGGRRQVAAIVADISGRHAAERALAESELRFRSVLEAAPNAIVGVGIDGLVVYANPQVERTFGYPPSEIVGRPIELLLPARVRATHEAHRHGYLARPVARPMGIGMDLAGRRRDGTEFPVEISLSPVDTPEGPLVFATVADISARKLLEEQLLHAQKMEGIGRLAGGVAHDFNNLLTVIAGYSRALLQTMDADDPDRRRLEAIREAGDRAAAMTQQLLAFSRRQVLRPQVLELNAVVRGMLPMLLPLLGDQVTLVTDLRPAAGRVRVDPGQLDQIVLNLAVNARDAMPAGGTLTIRTEAVEVDDARGFGELEVAPGPYAVLAVADTGMGMVPDTRRHLFEPFFSTKGGSGTGLGLATIYGIVRQSGGGIAVRSAPGAGSEFTILLPRVEEELEPAPSVATTGDAGSGRILLVEDEASVREFARFVLEGHGYEVVEASGPREALERLGREGLEIDLLVTDVVMPRMTGPDLARELLDVRPELPVLYVSGFADATRLDGVARPGTGFLRKPYSPEALLGALAQLRARTPSGG